MLKKIGNFFIGKKNLKTMEKNSHRCCWWFANGDAIKQTSEKWEKKYAAYVALRKSTEKPKFDFKEQRGMNCNAKK